MEKLRIEVEKALPKRDIKSRLMRSRNIHRATRCNTFDAIAQLGGDRAGDNVVISQEENGVVRLKIVVKKQNLKLVVDQLTKNNRNDCRSLRSSVPMALSLEQRLNLMRRRHNLRANKAKACCRSSYSWRPTLHSIPE